MLERCVQKSVLPSAQPFTKSRTEAGRCLQIVPACERAASDTNFDFSGVIHDKAHCIASKQRTMNYVLSIYHRPVAEDTKHPVRQTANLRPMNLRSSFRTPSWQG